MENRPPRAVLTAEVKGRAVRVEIDRDKTIIGRSMACDMVLRDERVSRQHATVLRQGDRWSVFDMGSANGTRLNGRRIIKEELRDGDVIGVGGLDVGFSIMKAASSTSHTVMYDDRPRPNYTRTINLAALSEALDDSQKTEDALRVSIKTLKLFSDAAKVLATARNIDGFLENILDLCFANVPADRAVVALYGGDGELVPRATRTRRASAGRITISRSITEEAIQSRQALLVAQIEDDARFSQQESIMQMDIRSAMCAPLYHEGRVGGFIYMDSQSMARRFRAEHLEILSTLAVLSQVGVEQQRLQSAVETERKTRERLARYSSPKVVDRIVRESPNGDDAMIAEEYDVSVVFADLSGFTSMSERLEPPAVSRVLNAIFERLTDAVFAEEGTLDKYMGDGMMAFFGAPIPQEDHAERAIRSALRMLRELDDVNESLGTSHPIRMRIGINSGPVVVGDIGSPRRKDYTVIGDTVNVASRLESSVAKPGQIAIGPRTEALIRGRFECEPLGECRLKGKEKSIPAFRVVPPTD